MSTDSGINNQEEINNLIFHSRFPTVIFCGPDLIYIYNQANAPNLKSKHPHVFGRPFSETHPEHFDHVKSNYER
ncbi:2000_t:CDS:2 [Gigaspora rosea]|nr:2000_t:CDS:2 [Gigaspora rosea]